jgi:hypothetical protein
MTGIISGCATCTHLHHLILLEFTSQRHVFEKQIRVQQGPRLSYCDSFV